MSLALLLQSTPYDRGYALGQALGPCCCLCSLAVLALGVTFGVVWAVRRSQPVSAPPSPPARPMAGAAPNAPPPSHYQWSEGAKPDFGALQKQQAELFGRLAPSQLPESDAINAAAKKLVAQDFDGAIAAYEEVAARFPHRAADAHGQIGAAWFFKRDHDRALFHYRKAIELGAPADRMADDIREAEDAKRRGQGGTPE